MAGGGPSIFKQSLDLWALTASLAVVIFMTIVFELAVHKCENRFGNHQLYGPMLQKVMAEFTVLGFVAICTILAIKVGSWLRCMQLSLWPSSKSHTSGFSL